MTKEIQNRLFKWCEENFLSIEEIDKGDVFYKIGGKEDVYMLIEPVNGKIIDEDCCFPYYDDDEDPEVFNILNDGKVNFVIFEFGKRFYYTKLISYKNQFNSFCFEVHFNDLKFIGEAKVEITLSFIHLGSHTQYELMNGCNDATLWADKAIFLKQDAIAICDKNTLAGSLPFQLGCSKKKIKSIIGYSATVAYNYDANKEEVPETNDLKLYVKNEIGWRNLLQINKAINVTYNKFIPENILLEHTEGLICVFSPNSIINETQDKKEAIKILQKYKNKFDDVFYQISSVEYYDDRLDMKQLNKIQFYLKNLYSVLQPVLINDSYYVEKEMWILKDYINKASGKVQDYSRDEYFKNLDETFDKLSLLFEDEEKLIELFSKMCENTINISTSCDFEIENATSKIPKYKKIYDKNDPNRNETNEEMFYRLIEEGISERLDYVQDEEMSVYLAQIEKELDIMLKSDVIDYMLILWDIIDWARRQGIMVGPGRGSVSGSLIAYLIKITDVDPIKHDLLFERFMNPARFMPDVYYDFIYKGKTYKKIKSGDIFKETGKTLTEEIEKNKGYKILHKEFVKRADSLMDIDTDFMVERREEVKLYISSRFGELHTCSIGSYTTFGLRGSIKDFGKLRGLDFSKTNFLTKDIDNQLDYEFKDLFKYALKSSELKKFINEFPDIVHCIKYCLGQKKTASIHASAVIIVPEKDLKGNDANIFNWIPVRDVEGRLVSEWEGKYTDKAGFIKEDILGLNQLDKLNHFNYLMKKNGKKKINWNNLELEDEKTFYLFKKGWNEDVFQLNSGGLKAYSIKVKPDNFEDITAMTALYRPGPMASNAHNDFADFKNKIKRPKYDFGLKEVTEKTQGLYIYQEQIMKAVIVLGGFTAIDSENFRSAIKKFDRKIMDAYESRFIQGAIEHGCEKKESEKIWQKLLAFSGYGFNKAHSVAYTLMTFWSQWAKANHPLEFWTASLQFATEEDIPKRIDEMRKIKRDLKQDIILKPPSVNYSDDHFTCDKETNSIYWSISKIKGLGESVTPKIIEERKRGGNFYSYEEFKTRFAKKDVNRAKLFALILSGAFDDVEGISVNKPEERLDLVKKHFLSYKEPLPEEYKSSLVLKKYFWIKKQKELTGYGYIDYKELVYNDPDIKKYKDIIFSGEEFETSQDYTKCIIVGEVLYINEKKSKHGEWLRLTMLSNYSLINVNIWNDKYVEYNELLIESVGKIILIKGITKFSNYQNNMQLNSDETTIIKIIE